MHIAILKIKKKKNHKKQLISLSNLKNIIFRKHNWMSKIFTTLYLKFYSNVKTYNQTYEYV